MSHLLRVARQRPRHSVLLPRPRLGLLAERTQLTRRLAHMNCHQYNLSVRAVESMTLRWARLTPLADHPPRTWFGLQHEGARVPATRACDTQGKEVGQNMRLNARYVIGLKKIRQQVTRDYTLAARCQPVSQRTCRTYGRCITSSGGLHCETNLLVTSGWVASMSVSE